MPSAPVKIGRQLAVFLANRPGTLRDVCQALADAKINIYALSVSDTVDHAVVRLVVSDTDKALDVFDEHHTFAVESDVLLIEGDSRPGSLAEIADALARGKVNIEYAYLATSPGSRRGLCIIRPSNVEKAYKLLTA
jgi:hypothetical protein